MRLYFLQFRSSKVAHSSLDVLTNRDAIIKKRSSKMMTKLLKVVKLNADCVFCNFTSGDLIYDPVNVFVSEPQRHSSSNRQTKTKWESGRFCRHILLPICQPFKQKKTHIYKCQIYSCKHYCCFVKSHH